MSDSKLTPIVPLLAAAERASQAGSPAAIGAFNVNFYTQAEGILEGLRRADAPGIVQASKGACKFQGGADKVAYMLNIPDQPYRYDEPDEYRIAPHEGAVPYDWSRRDG